MDTRRHIVLSEWDTKCVHNMEYYTISTNAVQLTCVKCSYVMLTVVFDPELEATVDLAIGVQTLGIPRSPRSKLKIRRRGLTLDEQREFR